jgi:uncharacterized membrane protein
MKPRAYLVGRACALQCVASSIGYAQCVGDCNGDSTVDITDLIIGVDIALGVADVGTCEAFADSHGKVDVAQLIQGVNNALNGCLGSQRTPSFLDLGLPPGSLGSIASAVSADGTTVAVRGLYPAENETAFRWRSDTGLVALDSLAKLPWSFAAGLSANGDVIVGTNTDSINYRPVRWSASLVAALPALPAGAGYGDAKGVSADGAVIVGRILRPDNQTPWSAALWRGGEPARLIDDQWSEAAAVTPDGRVVAGTRFTAPGGPFRWEEATGVVLLSESGNGAVATAISSDGRVICGNVIGGVTFAFRWTQESGLVPLPKLPGKTPFQALNSSAFGVNENGSITVGSANDGVAVIWDSTGVHAIADLLEQRGIHLGGWQLESAFGVTPDGQTIVGVGFSPAQLPVQVESAWIASLPRTAP